MFRASGEKLHLTWFLGFQQVLMFQQHRLGSPYGDYQLALPCLAGETSEPTLASYSATLARETV